MKLLTFLFGDKQKEEKKIDWKEDNTILKRYGFQCRINVQDGSTEYIHSLNAYYLSQAVRFMDSSIFKVGVSGVSIEDRENQELPCIYFPAHFIKNIEWNRDPIFVKKYIKDIKDEI